MSRFTEYFERDGDEWRRPSYEERLARLEAHMARAHEIGLRQAAMRRAVASLSLAMREFVAALNRQRAGVIKITGLSS